MHVSGGLGVRILSLIVRSLGVDLESRANSTWIFKKKVQKESHDAFKYSDWFQLNLRATKGALHPTLNKH